jgi:transcriptional regulator with XRE-family HTH domain
VDEQKIRGILGKNIKKYRRQLYLSQEELAAKINIATNFLGEIENSRKWVSTTTLAKLTDALDVEAYQLFKSEETLPANITNILTQYANDALAKVDKSINDLQKHYISLQKNLNSD